MLIEKTIKKLILKSINLHSTKKFKISDIELILNKTEHLGQYTFVSFKLAKLLGLEPNMLCEIVKKSLVKKTQFIKECSVFNGFLNIDLSNNIFLEILDFHSQFFLSENFFFLDYLKSLDFKLKKSKIVIEFPSPNTNKPLHLGHLRNIFLGESIFNILKAFGNIVYKVNLINNRGIHICKSMLAYMKYSNNETPESAKLKGDHLIGKYYVLFEKKYKEQLQELNSKNLDVNNQDVPIIKEVKELLIKWEKRDPKIIKLWKTLNGWVYKGFQETFNILDINFDKVYYESDTYLFGKKIIQEGLKKNIFYTLKDNSIWVDLVDKGLDKKLVLRSDGTSVYITQDIGSADQRYKDFNFDRSIYIVGNEQNHHFKVLFEIIKKFKRKFANSLYHLSYGMVYLPFGKMKSREGTVVDADSLISDMIKIAEKQSENHGKIPNISNQQKREFNKNLALGALKYFLLKVDSKKKILFNPQDSIEFQGDTGPFLQYTHARIKNLIKKNKVISDFKIKNLLDISFLLNIEKKIILHIYLYKDYIIDAYEQLQPSIIAQYVFKLCKLYSKYYAEVNIMKEKNKNIKAFRLQLSKIVGNTIKSNLKLLGITAPDLM